MATAPLPPKEKQNAPPRDRADPRAELFGRPQTPQIRVRADKRFLHRLLRQLFIAQARKGDRKNLVLVRLDEQTECLALAAADPSDRCRILYWIHPAVSPAIII
jgi:hypothetical protein